MVATKAAVDVQTVLVNASKFLKRYPEVGEVFVKFAELIDSEGDANKALENLHKDAETSEKNTFLYGSIIAL